MIGGIPRRNARFRSRWFCLSGGDFVQILFRPLMTSSFAMSVAVKLVAAVVVVLAIAASHANAGQFRVRGPSGYGHTPWKYRYTAPRFYAQPDLGAAVAAALAGAALQLIPHATEALAAKLLPGASAPPVVTAQRDGSTPSSDALDDIEGNSRGITRQEVEAAGLAVPFRAGAHATHRRAGDD